MILEINLILCAKHDITINELLLLHKAHVKISNPNIDTYFPYISNEEELNSLIKKGFLIKEKNGIRLSSEGSKIVGFKEEKKVDFNFEEFFLAYPHKCPDGRILRPKSASKGSSIIDAYQRLKSAYDKKIKTKEAHDKAVKGLKIMVKEHEKRDALNYLNALQVVINQSKWELYEDGEVEEEEKVKSFNRIITHEDDTNFNEI